MSQTLGRMLTCDRCGKTVFEPWHNPWKDNKNKYKSYTSNLYFEETEGWISSSYFNTDESQYQYNNNHKTLCPDCEAKRKNLMMEFWENK